MLSYYNLGKYRKDSSLTYHLLAEALRRGHNNRSHYVGDPDFYDVPTEGLISKARAKLLTKSISFDKASRLHQFKDIVMLKKVKILLTSLL